MLNPVLYVNVSETIMSETVELVALAATGCHDTTTSIVAVRPAANFDLTSMKRKRAPFTVFTPAIAVRKITFGRSMTAQIRSFPTPFTCMKTTRLGADLHAETQAENSTAARASPRKTLS